MTLNLTVQVVGSASSMTMATCMKISERLRTHGVPRVVWSAPDRSDKNLRYGGLTRLMGTQQAVWVGTIRLDTPREGRAVFPHTDIAPDSFPQPDMVAHLKPCLGWARCVSTAAINTVCITTHQHLSQWRVSAGPTWQPG